jgi:membrane protein insertase Oxa1/YidC/SpoIIIJ
MDRQEFFQSYMDHWGIADVLVDCYVDLLTMEMMNETNHEMARMVVFKQLLFEHHIKCKEQQIFEEEIKQLQDELKRIKNN